MHLRSGATTPNSPKEALMKIKKPDVRFFEQERDLGRNYKKAEFVFSQWAGMIQPQKYYMFDKNAESMF